MKAEQFLIARAGPSWAIKHDGSVLGYSNSPQEATRLAQDLANWVQSRGRSAEVAFEHESCARAEGRS